MAGIKFDRFLGLVPRTPAALLPQHNAIIAENCDFAYGELHNTRGGALFRTMTNAVRSVYTDDGQVFYTWDEDVDAVRSPLARDLFDRIYYTTATDFRVASRSGMSPTGGRPSVSYRVGVPRPTVPPVLAEGPPIVLPPPPDPGGSGADYRFFVFYEADGVKYLEEEFFVPHSLGGGMWAIPNPNPYGEAVPLASYPTPSDFPAIGVETYHGQPQIYVTTDPLFGTLYFRWSSISHSYYTLTSGWNPAARRQYNVRVSSGGMPVLDVYHHSSSFYNPGSGYELRYAYEDTTFGPQPPNLFPSALDIEVHQITLFGGGTDPTTEDETRAYVYTYANIYNEESAPSPPATISAGITAPINVTCQRDLMIADYAPIKEIRVYRTTGDATTDYFFVGAIPTLGLGGTAFLLSDSSITANLNEALASIFDIAPDPELVGLIELPNGILMAFRGNELHFSDPYRPWSWPPSYVLTVSGRQIVGAIPIGTGALVTTTGQPFFVSGVSPESMTQSVITVDQAGVSKWALANVGDSVVYASHDGLVLVSGGQASMALSETHFTRDVWRGHYAVGLDKMRFAVWDGRLIVYSTSSGGEAIVPFMLSLDEAAGSMTDLPLFVSTCTFVSPATDQCYYAIGPDMYIFAGGSAQESTWRSREIRMPRPMNLGAAQVLCEGNWTFKLYINEANTMVLKHTETGLSGLVSFTLPSGFTSDRYRFQISGTGVFRELRVATSMTELRGL